MAAGVTQKSKPTWLALEPLPATCPYCKVSSENDGPLVFLHQLGLSIESHTAEKRSLAPAPPPTRAAGLSTAHQFSHWWKGVGGWIQGSPLGEEKS